MKADCHHKLSTANCLKALRAQLPTACRFKPLRGQLSIVNCRLSIILFLLLLFLGSCTAGKRPSGVLSPQRMEEVLYDYHLAQAVSTDLRGGDRYQKELYLNYVFDKHGTTEAQFDSSMVWYARNPKALSAIYEHLLVRTDAELDRVSALKAVAERRVAKPVEGDSADLWYELPHLLFSSFPPERNRTFSIPADSNFQVRDSLVFDGQLVFMRHGLANVSLVATFDDGTCRGVDSTFSSTGHLHLVLPTDTTLVRELNGTIHWSPAADDDQLLFTGISLTRYRKIDN